MSANIVLGKRGEDAASDFLIKHSYQILERNYRSGRWGEIDLICKQGGDLVFVEVKTRRGQAYGTAIQAVTSYKIDAIRRSARHYALTHQYANASLRIDVVTVDWSGDDDAPVCHLYRNIDA
jgi:putative endonuclease